MGTMTYLPMALRWNSEEVVLPADRGLFLGPEGVGPKEPPDGLGRFQARQHALAEVIDAAVALVPLNDPDPIALCCGMAQDLGIVRRDDDGELVAGSVEGIEQDAVSIGVERVFDLIDQDDGRSGR